MRVAALEVQVASAYDREAPPNSQVRGLLLHPAMGPDLVTMATEFAGLVAGVRVYAERDWDRAGTHLLSVFAFAEQRALG